ncbi:MAG TPA: glycerophosphodiester phosphodiesterase family protein [Candidatus Sulfotelmatobacter sp.]|nr:glycerophosphodiester phosphodiesterase family protein [Candidatus Sulfotelmatobacter sp.]
MSADQRRPLIHAHRGASAAAPENTLAAFRLGLEQGADALEMDLQLTKDRAVVVLHDPTVERVTDGLGRIAGLTLAEVRKLDAGAKFGAAFRGERIPTLAEVIALLKEAAPPTARLNLELKYPAEPPADPGELPAEVVRMLRGAGVTQRVFVQSFLHAVLPRVKALAPEIPVGLLVDRREAAGDPVALARQYGADYYAPDYRAVTPALVAALHAAGIPVVAWTVDDPGDLRRMLAAGIGGLAGDGIITNRPDRALAVVNGRR